MASKLASAMPSLSPIGRAALAVVLLVANAVPTATAASTIDPRFDGSPPASVSPARDLALSINPSAADVAVESPAPEPLFTVRARRGNADVRSAPRSDGPILSGLYYDTYLKVFEQTVTPDGTKWYRIQLWGVLDGWIRADQTETGDPPIPTPSPASPASSGGGSSPSPSKRSAIVPLKSAGTTRDWYNLRASAAPDAAIVDTVPPDTEIAVTSWQSDDDGSIWYHTAQGSNVGWMWAGGVNLASSATLPRRVSTPALSAVEGKGMWVPVPLLEMASPDAIASAARELGLSHLYVEAGDSERGFYGRAEIARLLPVAHKAGLAVIGWNLTRLSNIAVDVRLVEEVARYQSPSGDRVDGVAPDVEYNMNADDVRAFSQILRADLGPDALIVGTIYPAGSWTGKHHPVAAIMSRSVDVLTPMAYWREGEEPVAADVVSRYIAHAVTDIQEAVGDGSYPVEVIGQTYDPISRNGSGPNNPPANELQAALGSAKGAGAYGVSLFQWGTAAPDAWDALRSLAWGRGH